VVIYLDTSALIKLYILATAPQIKRQASQGRLA
jgi:hypothetical protein